MTGRSKEPIGHLAYVRKPSLWLHYTIQFVNSTIDLSRWIDRYTPTCRNKEAIRFSVINVPLRWQPFNGQYVDTTSFFSSCLSNSSSFLIHILFFLFQSLIFSPTSLSLSLFFLKDFFLFSLELYMSDPRSI